ncbi:hypothetical protein BpHYR1_017038 [Brachionus plicatilis]|uniref:Uncharacterized protein n=1 Tax=Brachionus plicatilis TaxID=10195 RepID=A0A3M7SQM6_BRAPC|nr:hypothetical protein BpHYR1_017038 [Brachionus plicatilis]
MNKKSSSLHKSSSNLFQFEKKKISLTRLFDFNKGSLRLIMRASTIHFDAVAIQALPIGPLRLGFGMQAQILDRTEHMLQVGRPLARILAVDLDDRAERADLAHNPLHLTRLATKKIYLGQLLIQQSLTNKVLDIGPQLVALGVAQVLPVVGQQPQTGCLALPLLY